jgi:4'-phosphopantetheinyl transferase
MLDHVNPEHHLRSMIGYHLAWESSLIGMVMVQGKQREVVNIGFGIKQVAVEPRDATVSAYVESLSHKLTGLEMSFLAPSLGDEVVLRRLCILLALKAAYIKAIGQPIGFDWSRLEFNISEETCSGDGQPLTGWEFRLYKSHLGVQRRGILVEESYQCVTAHFRGTADSKFVWQDNNKDLESWVQFINIDQMTNVIPKLTD